jgi:hypothetical protein
MMQVFLLLLQKNLRRKIKMKKNEKKKIKMKKNEKKKKIKK